MPQDTLISPEEAINALTRALGIEKRKVIAAIRALEQSSQPYVLVPADWLGG